MKCLECGADIYEGIKKCPYCKTPTQSATEDEKFRNFDFKYTITSDEHVRKLRDSVRVDRKNTTKRNAVEKYFADRRAAKRAARRAARRSARIVAQMNPDTSAATTKAAATAVKPVKTVRKAEKPKKTARKLNFKKPSFKKLNLKKINFKKFSFKGFKSMDKKIIRIGGLAVGLVVFIWLMIVLAGLSSNKDIVPSYTYVSDNSMYMVYKGKNLLLSENVLNENNIRKLDETGKPGDAELIAKNKGLVKTNKERTVTYFFEDYDAETNSGRLCMIKKGNEKKVSKIAEEVHNSIVMTKNGEGVLYLQTADKNGDMGVLHYWESGMKEPYKIATDIDHGTFEYAGDGGYAVFLQNLNRVEMSGDLYAKNLKNLKEEKVKLDTDVCKLFGTSQDGNSHLYAKEYNPEDGTFYINAINKNNRILQLGTKTKKEPFVQKKKNFVYILAAEEDGTNTLYNVDVNSAQKEEISSGVSSILMTSKDEKTVIYDKVYSGKVAAYYAYTKGKQPLKIAENVVVDYNVVANKPQMAASLDGSKVLYISEFEAFKGGGTLSLCEYKNGKKTVDKQIAEDVYACFRAEGDKFIFLKDYSTSRKVCDVYLLEGDETTLLKKEVSPQMFGVTKSGDNIYYISNYNTENGYGTLERMNLDGNVQELASEVVGFDITDNEEVLFYKNRNIEDGRFDLYLNKKGKDDWGLINKSVGQILTY